jgi:hypothetical protein
MTAEKRAIFDAYSCKQPGDPIKGASLIVDLITKSGPWAQCEHLPLSVSLGKDAAKFIRETIRDRSIEHEKWVSFTENTNCDSVESLMLAKESIFCNLPCLPFLHLSFRCLSGPNVFPFLLLF